MLVGRRGGQSMSWRYIYVAPSTLTTRRCDRTRRHTPLKHTLANRVDVGGKTQNPLSVCSRTERSFSMLPGFPGGRLKPRAVHAL